MRVPILNYHWFGDPDHPVGRSPEFGIRPADFRAQMTWLGANGYHVIPLAALVDALHANATATAPQPLPPRPVVITFDDGYKDFAEHALPVLAELGLPATLFVVSGLAGGTNLWDRKFGEPERRLLDFGELRAAALAGVDIGSHSVDHPDLRTLAESQMLDQCRRSRLDLEDQLGRRVRFLAYPHGAYDRRVKRAAREAGYDAACGVLLKPLDLLRSDDFALMRAIIHADRGEASFRRRVRLAAPWHRAARPS